MAAVMARGVVCRAKVRIAAVRRVALIAVLGALTAGCGGEETVSPTAETVVGEQPQAQPQPQGDPQAGAQVFEAKGCGGCHAFEPANSSGQTGPPLNDLAALAEKAGQPVEEFTRQSITQPDAYVEPGFPEGVMPAWSGTEQELNDLVAFLTQS
jgi:mono/diheme cytochrome c family protein